MQLNVGQVCWSFFSDGTIKIALNHTGTLLHSISSVSWPFNDISLLEMTLQASIVGYMVLLEVLVRNRGTIQLWQRRVKLYPWRLLFSGWNEDRQNTCSPFIWPPRFETQPCVSDIRYTVIQKSFFHSQGEAADETQIVYLPSWVRIVRTYFLVFAGVCQVLTALTLKVGCRTVPL